jgi:metallo-beta-lactamase class B
MKRGAVAATADQRPKRDMVIRDGEKLTVGDTTITFYVTPAHTAGMVSPLVPVFDNGKPHLAAQWGGLGAGLRGDVNGKFGPGDEAYFRQYAASAFRYRDIITAAGADVMFAPHPTQAGAGWKAEALFARKPGDPNPFVIGKDAVRDAMTVIAECATAQAEQVAMYPNPG